MAVVFARLVWIVMGMVLVSPLADVVTSPGFSSVAIIRTYRPLVVQRAKTSDSVPTDIELPMASLPISTNPDFFRAIITAYSSSPNETDDTPFITASGRRVFDGLPQTLSIRHSVQDRWSGLYLLGSSTLQVRRSL